ncbi:alpha/beta hydrolase [Microbacterium sp. SLBN-111]|uniref:alpha/beta hydrolase n=1 Tax=Microbacterium sp. SLBN-111 TaxID=3377733 RepID=UPI003C738DBA
MFAHGGGWVAGDLDNNDALCRALAAATGTQVLSVDYWLAPEHPFPAGLDDLDRALRFAAAGAGGLVDPTLLGVAGHSAGGNLAAALALRSREGRAPGIRVQVLLCPVLDAPDPDRPSYRAYTENLPLTAKGMQWYWGLYLRDATTPVPVEAAPLRAPELASSAPAVIVAAGVDPLSDEAGEYAERLTASGTPVEFVRREGVPHLFLVFPSMPARDEVLAAVAPAVRAAFA